MRRRAVVLFAVLASLLVVTAVPAAASHGPVVVSNHTTDTDFDGASELTDVSVIGGGSSAYVELDRDGDYNVVADSGDGAAESNRALVGDQDDGTIRKAGLKVVPNENITVDTINVSVGGVIGSDYGFVVDIYAIQKNPDGTFAEGTLIKDDWDPDFSTGVQTIQLDTSFRVESGQNWTIEFDTQSSDGDGTTDQIQIETDEDSGLTDWYATQDGVLHDWGGNITLFRSNVPDGTYISATHSAENVQEGFTNLTLSNASAEVTWLADTDGDGTFETEAVSSTFTTTGNHTLDLSGTDASAWRVNVTFVKSSEPLTAELHDEGIKANTSAPQVDNASATPNGSVGTTNPTLEIDVNDTDFGLAQGDSVAVEFFVDGDSEGTDTLTSNGTAQQQVTLTGGDHTWSVQANDSYSHSVDSATFSADVPANLTIRNETTPHGIVSGCTANVRFYETTDDNPLISEQTDSDGDGNVSLVGLPVGTEFVASVKCDGYYNRTVLIEDIFSQSNAFLLHQATNDGDLIRFEIDDRTGLFAEDGEFIIERAINESEYSSADGFAWVRIAGDEIGATDSFVITLEHEQRYRLRIQNDAGDSRILKTYIPQGDETEQVVVGRVGWESSEGNATVFNASIEDESTLGNTPPVIQIQFVNPANLTAEPDKAIENFNYSVFEAGNASNEIDSGSASGDLGTFYAETNITDDQADEKWIIQVEYEADGDTVLERRVVGGAGTDIQADQDWLGLFALFGITSIGLLYGQRTASIGIALMWITAGVAMVFELIVINEAWYIVSGFIVAAALIRGELR